MYGSKRWKSKNEIRIKIRKGKEGEKMRNYRINNKIVKEKKYF